MQYVAHSQQPTAPRGFTLVEMVVTVGIFVIISSIVIVRNSRFDSATLLQNLAYDIALSIQQAQQYGINVRQTGSGDTSAFDRPYGIHFDANATTYYLFSDIDGNGVFGGVDSPELLETYKIGRGATIGEICDLTVDDCSLRRLDVVFRRPNPDAVINDGAVSQASVELIPARDQDSRRLVKIYTTGQISIERVDLSNERNPDNGGRGGIIRI